MDFEKRHIDGFGQGMKGKLDLGADVDDLEIWSLLDEGLCLLAAESEICTLGTLLITKMSVDDRFQDKKQSKAEKQAEQGFSRHRLDPFTVALARLKQECAGDAALIIGFCCLS